MKRRVLPMTREEIKRRIKVKNSKIDNNRDIKAESTSINKTTPFTTIKKNFVGS